MIRLVFSVFLIGLSSLIIEIYSITILNLFIINNTFVSSIVISSFLSGLALSALIFSKIKLENARNTIFFLQISLYIYGISILKNIDLIPQVFKYYGENDIAKYLIIWLFLFFPAFFIGGAFPLISGLYQQIVNDTKSITKNIGLIYFVDMLGAIFGALICGFFLIPTYGLNITLGVALFIGLLSPLIIIKNRLFIFINSVLILSIPFYYYMQNNELSESFNMPIAEVKKYLGKKVLFQEKSPYGIITVSENEYSRWLSINLRMMCMAHIESQYSESEEVIARYTIDNLDENSEVLNIGLGCGLTAGGIVNRNKVRHLTLVEINPVIIKAAKTYFKEFQRGLFTSNRITLLNTDGGKYLRNIDVGKKYESIIIDIEEPTIAHSSILFTKEYFEIAKNRLTSDGIFSLWSHHGGEDYSKILYNTLKSVFKNVHYRADYGAVLFFASDKREIRLPNSVQENYLVEKSIKDNNNTNINTIDNRILNKYFKTKKYFRLPESYNDEFIMKK